VKRCYFILLLVSASVPCLGKPAANGNLKFDLSQIGFMVDGKQICEDNGRLQDFPSNTMDEIITAGPDAIPILIGMLTDSRLVKTREPLICYWPPMSTGDVAYCLLSDLFSGTEGTTLPGADWDDMLGQNHDEPAWVSLSKYS
jgi:hypothetical protein